MNMENYFNTMWDNYKIENNIKTARYCPLCGYYGELTNDSSGRTNNYKCPNCNSAERNRLYWLYFEKEDITNTNCTILHIAPDKSTRIRLSSNRKIKYIVAGIEDLQKINQNDSSIDLIIANYVIDRVNNLDVSIKEIMRVLKINGKVEKRFDQIQLVANKITKES